MQNSPKEILIIGGGEVGVKTAQRLHSQRNITMIEKDPEIIKKMSNQGDIQLIQGSGTCPITLEEARAHEMDMVIAVTNSDEVNIMSCWLIRQLIEAHRKTDEASDDLPNVTFYARVRSPSLERYVRGNLALGISHVINPERLCVDKIVERLTYNNLIETLTFERGLINLYGVKIVADAPAANQDLFTLTEGKDLTIAAMSKDMSPETIIPSKDDVIEVNDDIYFCASRDRFPRIYRQLCGSPTDKTTVYIAGASKIGLEIARKLASNEGEEDLLEDESATEKTDMRFKVHVFDANETLIEQIEQEDQEGRINYFCDKLSDLSELHSHSIKPQDVIITCSDDAEENIVGALLARKLGFKRIMIIANNERHHEVIREQGLEVVKNPRQIAVVELSQKINSDLTIAFQTLSGAEDTEVREFIVNSDNPFIGKTLAQLSASDDWPNRGALVASIMRGSCAIMLSGATDIRDGDRLFVISHVQHFKKIEGLFEPKRSGLRLWPRSLL